MAHENHGTHEKHMNRAIELARRNPDAPFGCVIVNAAGETAAEAVNDASRSPILHGETAAIISLFDQDSSADTSDLTLYTTAEPCPMCSGAILWSGIPRLYYGTSIATLKRLGLDQIDLACEEVSRQCSFGSFESEGGLLQKQCDALFEEMYRRLGA
jgi:tRNA(Arg) A34 adenosine deaminase TadA